MRAKTAHLSALLSKPGVRGTHNVHVPFLTVVVCTGSSLDVPAGGSTAQEDDYADSLFAALALSPLLPLDD